MIFDVEPESGAPERKNITDYAVKINEANNLSNIINLLEGKVQEVVVPDGIEKDIVIYE